MKISLIMVDIDVDLICEDDNPRVETQRENTGAFSSRNIGTSELIERGFLAISIWRKNSTCQLEITSLCRR